MGFESRTPYSNDVALAANITNEGGAEGRYRVLKNILGLWLLQRVLKERQISDLQSMIGHPPGLALQQAGVLPATTDVKAAVDALLDRRFAATN